MGVVTVASSTEAPADKVFDLLADVERFSEWYQFIGEVVSFSSLARLCLSRIRRFAR